MEVLENKKKINMRNMKIGGFLYILLWLYGIVAWIVNLVMLFRCDFASPYKDEVIHIIGVLLPPASMVTVWF